MILSGSQLLDSISNWAPTPPEAFAQQQSRAVKCIKILANTIESGYPLSAILPENPLSGKYRHD